MFSKFTLFISIIIILFVHFTILSNQKIQEKKIVSLQEPNITKISVKKVILKEKELKKIEPKKIVKQEPIKKEIKKIVKKAKEKIVKKELTKPVEKIEKVVKHDTPKLIPTSTIKTQPIVPKKVIVSRETKNIIKNEYLSKLRAEIEKNKIYPKRAKRLKQQGKVVVTFLLLKNGQIKNINLKNGSSFRRIK